MNEPISWDPSLVKKFSSSNHFKLLNQLRNEVKKYPLNNKRNLTAAQSKNIDQNNKNRILELLAIDLFKLSENFEITLLFNNNAFITLSTEVLEITLEDQNKLND